MPARIPRVQLHPVLSCSDSTAESRGGWFEGRYLMCPDSACAELRSLPGLGGSCGNVLQVTNNLLNAHRCWGCWNSAVSREKGRNALWIGRPMSFVPLHRDTRMGGYSHYRHKSGRWRLAGSASGG